MADIQPYLQKMVERFANPNVQLALKGFTKTIQFKFTDTKETWLLSTVDGKTASVSQGSAAEDSGAKKPDILVTMATDILAGVMDKKINGTTAYMQRKIQVKGAMEDLMKLQKIMM